MIGFIKGILRDKDYDNITVECGGVGFVISVTASCMANLPGLDEEVKIYTYLHVREDEMSLYGFESPEEKKLFLQLITVSGVGSKTAIGILSAERMSAIINSIINEDTSVIANCKGGGKQKGDIPTFNYENLRWNKIILCTDADEDGFQIRTLLLTLFYRLLPTLIEKGRVYIAETPLFEIETKNETFFAYDEREKDAILKRLEGKKYTINRFKGLGEATAPMMEQAAMNPATRRLVRVSPTDAEATFKMFDTLLGDNLPARKEFIQQNASRYAKDADI